MKYQIMPDLTADEYNDLKTDISLRGVMIPIEYDEHGNVLDGHHRLRICGELGITDYPKVIRAGMTDIEKRFHARKLNIARRHLTQEQKRGFIRGQLVETPEKSDRQIATGLGVDHKTVGTQRQELEQRGEIPHIEKTVDTLGREQPRKPIAIFNPTATEEKALQNPDITDKLLSGEASTVKEAQRETKREEIISKLESIEAMEVKEIQGVYDVIIIDPPWDMKKIERDERPNQSEFDYPTMTEEELAKLEIPAANDCHVWLWTTHKFMPMALKLLTNWDLKYVCTFVWHKPGGFQPFGLPQYNCEFALYARKGTPSFINTKDFSTCFFAPRTGHSEKPEEFYSMVKRVTAGRRLDMFNRRKIKDFDCWGKESLN